MLVKEQRIIDIHLLIEVFLICHTREIEANKVEMLDVRVALINIIDRVPDTYNINEGWVVKK
jgi:hypothetical protein